MLFFLKITCARVKNVWPKYAHNFGLIFVVLFWLRVHTKKETSNKTQKHAQKKKIGKYRVFTVTCLPDEYYNNITDNKNIDFVSRTFCPNVGIDEDPVCGSAHSTLCVFWHSIKSQNKWLHAYQDSQRSGYCFFFVLFFCFGFVYVIYVAFTK